MDGREGPRQVDSSEEKYGRYIFCDEGGGHSDSDASSSMVLILEGNWQLG